MTDNDTTDVPMGFVILLALARNRLSAFHQLTQINARKSISALIQ